MKLEQSFEVDAPLERVWEALVDVERVAPCLPGAAITGRNEDGSYNGTFTIKIGPTTASYAGRLEMQNVDESTHSATMHAQGSDRRGQGGATATIASRLSPADGQTRVEVVTDYHITGRLARFGRGGMIEDISERLLREFAARLQSSLSGGGGPPPTETETAPPPSEAPPPTGMPVEAVPAEAVPAEAVPPPMEAPSPPEAPAMQAPPPTEAPPPPIPPEAVEEVHEEQPTMPFDQVPEEEVTPEEPAAPPPPDEELAAPPPTPPQVEPPPRPEAAPPPPHVEPPPRPEPAPPPPQVEPPPRPEPAPPPPQVEPPLRPEPGPLPPPPPSPPSPGEALDAGSLVGSVLIERVKRNPKPLIAVAGGLLLLRMIRRRR